MYKPMPSSCYARGQKVYPWKAIILRLKGDTRVLGEGHTHLEPPRSDLPLILIRISLQE